MTTHIFTALLCSLLWAGTAIAVKLMGPGIPSPIFVFTRYLFAALFLLPFISYKSFIKSRQHTPIFIALGLCTITTFSCFFLALQHTAATTVSLILALQPILTLLTMAIIARKLPRPREAFSFMLAFAGVVIVITKGGMSANLFTARIGELYALGAVAALVAYSLIIKHIATHFTATVSTFMTCLYGLMFMLPFVLNGEALGAAQAVTLTNWGLLAYVGVIGTALAFLLYTRAVTNLGPATSSMIAYSCMPLFVFVLAFFILGDPITYEQIVGGLLVVSALIVGLRK